MSVEGEKSKGLENQQNTVVGNLALSAAMSASGPEASGVSRFHISCVLSERFV